MKSFALTLIIKGGGFVTRDYFIVYSLVHFVLARDQSLKYQGTRAKRNKFDLPHVRYTEEVR